MINYAVTEPQIETLPALIDRAALAKRSRYIPKNVRKLWSALRVCFYCGTRSDPMEFDHYTPFSASGENDATNIVLACRTCNRAKGTGLPFRTEVEALRVSADYLKRRAKRLHAKADRLAEQRGAA